MRANACSKPLPRVGRTRPRSRSRRSTTGAGPRYNGDYQNTEKYGKFQYVKLKVR
jgi:hypothetical protein